MTISASNFTVEHISGVAKSATAWFHTSDPGEFACTYPTGITGPATVKDPGEGERAWTIGNRGGQYLAYPAVHQTRHECTWLFEVDLAKIAVASQQATAYDYSLVAQSVNVAVPRRVNWGIAIDIYNQTHPNYRVICRFFRSADSSSNEAMMNGPTATTYTAAQVVRFAIIYSNIAPKSGVYIYHGSRANVAATGAAAPDGTMGGTEVFMLGCCNQIGRWGGVMSDGDLDAWFSAGTKPASPAFLYAGGHEITPSIQKIFDSATGKIDLYNYSVFSPAVASGDYTDTGFTSPLVEVPITIAADCTAGTHNITLRRTRVGIPVRTPALSDAVVYDDGVLPVTVVDTAPTGHVGPAITKVVKL